MDPSDREPSTDRDARGHLLGCPTCAAYADTYRTTVALARAAFEDSDSSAFAAMPEELVRRIVAFRRGGRQATGG